MIRFVHDRLASVASHLIDTYFLINEYTFAHVDTGLHMPYLVCK